MSNYSNIKTTDQFKNLMNELYFPSSDKIEELLTSKMQFLAVSGVGSPESEDFQQAVQALYGLAFSLKMGLKFGKIARPAGYFDFKMPPLEGLWWQNAGRRFNMQDKDNWRWQLMIMMPSYINKALVRIARSQATAKHPEIPYLNVKLENFDEGKVIQATHIGSYATEPETIEKLMCYARKYKYGVTGKHHEIYLGDPRRTSPEKLKTILRYSVK